MIRLQKAIADSGYCSRRKAEELIIKGQVFVNDKKITELGFKVSPKDTIEVDGDLLIREEKKYFLLYKPSGVVSTTKDEYNRRKITDLIKTDIRIYPIGRLDYDTTGLLLLTNDGEFANLITHPTNKIAKIYTVKIQGIINSNDVKNIKNGIIIDNKKTSKAKIQIKSINKKKKVSIVKITIFEGRNHQVKKMFESLGYEVLKLKREQISFLTLTGLKIGEYRSLTPKEIKKLYNEAVNKKE